MIRNTALLVLVTALMGSTAVVAQDGGVAVTTGVMVMNLPAIETGVSGSAAGSSSNSVDNLAIGGLLGIDARLNLGAVGDYQSFLGFSGYGGIAGSSSSNATTLSGIGTLVVPGYTTPTAYSIALTTVPASTDSRSTISNNGEPNDVNAPNQTGAVFAWGVNPGDPGNDPSFAYGGIFADGAVDRAAAFGAVADVDGNVMIATGDLTGVVVTNDISQSVASLGADLTLGLSGNPTSNVSVSGFVGPSYKYLGRDTTVNTMVNFPELGSALTPGQAEFPLYSRKRSERLSSHYVGGVIGGSMSTPVGDNMILNFGGKGGIYAMSTTATGTEVASVYGGNPAPTTNPTEVANKNGLSLSDNGVAYSVQGNLSLTMPLSPTTQFTIGGNGEYLSRVAGIGAGGSPAVTVTGGGNNASYSATEDLRPTLSFGDMWTFTGFATFSGQF